MKAFRSLILFFVVLTLLVPVGLVGESARAAEVLTNSEKTPVPQRDKPLPYASDRIIIKFRSGVMPGSAIQGSPATGRASVDTILSAFSLQTADRLFGAVPAVEAGELAQIYILRFGPGADLDSLITLLELDPNVEWAEPDYVAVAAATTPNDPHFADQWGLTKIEAPAAWDVTTGSPTIPIAIVDSGIQFTHPDLSGKLWVNPGETPGNGLDDDNNGYIDDVNGWDFVNADNAPADDNGHGTQVAGIAAAATNNGVGIAGVCWACKIMPVKVMQAGGVANYSDIAAGVLYAAQKGARVINLSLGGYSDSSALQSAVQAATETYGAVVVAGAGNDDLSTPFYPAAYEQVLAVGGTDQTDAKTALSNYGTWLDVTAPAEDIKSTFMGGDYGDVDGTSYAAPFAAGIAGLIRSQNPSWSANIVRAQIVHTADDIDILNPGLEGKLGSGRVNAGGAVSTSAQPMLSIEGYTADDVTSGRPEPGSTVDLDVTLYNDWADASNVQASLSSSDPNVTIVDSSASFGDIPAYETGTNATSFRFSVKGSAPYGHDMAMTLHVTAGGGYSADLLLTTQTASSIVEADATITTQTWTNDRIYLINKETGIPGGETLTIEPGTEIRFDGDYSLTVAGELIADGTEAQPILYTSNKALPAPGDWGQIKFLDSSVDATFDGTGEYVGGSILQYATIEFGRGITIDNSAPFISFNAIRQTLGTGIYSGFAEGLVIANNVISGGAFDQDFCGIYLGTEPGSFTALRNTVSEAGTGIEVVGAGMNPGAELIANRVVGCDEGIVAWGGAVTGNLLALNHSNGLRIGSGTETVIGNTIFSNGQAGIYLESPPSEIQHNNLIAGAGEYALRTETGVAIDATNNWWGVSGGASIEEVIYDDSDEFGIGAVDYSSYLTSPESDAPSYVTAVNISPDTTLGIQTATFEVAFSQPMDQGFAPELSFRSVKHGTWTVYNESNSGLPSDQLQTVATGPDGSHWFGTEHSGAAHLDGTNWTVYNTANSGLPHNHVPAIATDPDGSHWFGTGDGAGHFDGTNWTISDQVRETVEAIVMDPDGSVWFGTQGGGAGHFDGTNWTVYDRFNSGLPGDDVRSVATGADGSHWFGTDSEGAAHFDGTNWTVYDTSNSGLPDNDVWAVATNPDGSSWFGTYGGGAAHFDGMNWTVYNSSNSGLPGDHVMSILTNPDGSHWFGTWGGGVAHFDGSNWKVYDSSNSGLPGDLAIAIAADPDGSHWFGTFESGAAVLWNSPVYIIEDNGQWLNDHTYLAAYDITSLIPRDDYLLSVSGAIGTDGMEVAATIGYTITVDYAGAIGDTTPPGMPSVTACAGKTMSALSGYWSASDADSKITLYSYAIGTTPGGGEVVNWTNTTATLFDRTGLSLSGDQPYYVAVKARNEGGLWSAAAIPDAVYAGSGKCTTNVRVVYLPMIMR